MPVTPAMTGESGMSGIVGAGGFNPGTDPLTLTWQTAKGRVLTDGFGVTNYGELGFADAVQAVDNRKAAFVADFQGAPAVLYDGVDDRQIATVSIPPPFSVTFRCMVPSQLLTNGVFVINGPGADMACNRGDSTFPAPGFIIRTNRITVAHVSDSIWPLGSFVNYTHHALTAAPFFRLFEDGVEKSYVALPTAAVGTGDTFTWGSDGTFFLDGYHREGFVSSGLVDPQAASDYLDSEWPP